MKLFLAALLAVVVLLAGGIVLLTGDFLGEAPAPPRGWRTAAGPWSSKRAHRSRRRSAARLAGQRTV